MATNSSAANARRNLPLVAGSLSLTADEIAVLFDLQSPSRSIRRDQEIISEGRRCTTAFMLTEGIAIRYRILRDGQRQILNLLLPGDVAGLRSCFFDTALYSVKTLTRSAFAPIPRSRLLALFDSHPQLAAKLFWSYSCETAICSEHLVAIGRRSALERVAHFLLELLTRLQAVGLADDHSFRLPLTQEVISDVLGLSITYVNRLLHQLREAGLVRIREQVVVIENIEELSALADFEHTYLKPHSITELLAEQA